MALPQLLWSQPVGTIIVDGSPAPASTEDSHHLNNDLNIVSDRFGSTGTFAPGEANASKSGQYMVSMNDISRTLVGAVEATSSSPAVPAYYSYTYNSEGNISLNGGVYELCPFSAGVAGGTKTWTDFAGTGATGYPKSYATNDGSPQQSGPPICGGTNFTNVESSYTYTLSTMQSSHPVNATYFMGQTTNPNPGGGPDISCGTGKTNMSWGAHTGTTSSPNMYYVGAAFSGSPGGPGTPATPGCPEGNKAGNAVVSNKIPENWTVGGTYNNGTNPRNPHNGSVHFKVIMDSEAEISGGNGRVSVTGTAVWNTGQDRTVTITTSQDHLLTDSNNKVTISDASNSAVNGIWNVYTVDSSTQFKIQVFSATCSATPVSGLNIITYDGIDKTGGLLRSQTGTINTIQKVVYYHHASGTTPATHSIDYRYIGSHGLGSSGTVTVSVSGSGLASGTHGSNPIPAGDFTGSVTINSGTQFTRSIASGLAGGSGTTDGQVTSLASGLNASTFNTGNDIEIVAGGMFGNNKVILKGDVTPTADVNYSFHGNTTSGQVSSITFRNKAVTPRSMFVDAGLILDQDSGRVYTSNAPTSQPSDNDTGSFDGVTGGMKPIDTWCPHYMHGRAEAQARNDATEVLKANTSGNDAMVQLSNNPMTNTDDELTTYLHPRYGFHETIHFTLQAYKNTAHTTSRAYGSHTPSSNDYVNRDFHINVYQNMKSVRNDFAGTVYPIDTDNNFEVANTDTAQKNTTTSEFITNEQNLRQNYANGSFDNF